MHGKSYICQCHCAFLPQIIVLYYVTSTAEDLLNKIAFLYMGLSCKELKAMETQAKIELMLTDRMTDTLLIPCLELGCGQTIITIPQII